MIAPTHIAFGIFISEFGLSSFEMEMPAESFAGVFICSAIGSLTSDIDHYHALPAKLLRFTGIPRFIEHRFARRTFTHSLAFVTLATLMASPLLFLQPFGSLYLMSYALSVFSHIFLDAFTKEGAQWTWPRSEYWVIPMQEGGRVRVGSAVDWSFFGVFALLAIVFSQIATAGLRTSFYQLTKDPWSGAREAREWFSTHRMTANIKAHWRDTLDATNYDSTYEVVAVRNDDIFFRDGDAVFNTAMGGSVTISRIWVKRGEPIERKSFRISFDNQMLEPPCYDIPDDSIITGTIIVTKLAEWQKKDNYTTRSEEFSTINFGSHGFGSDQIELTYCPVQRFRAALFQRGIFVMYGGLTVTTANAEKGGYLKWIR